jgi:exodeoxyribonuclease VII large subunit
LPEFPRRLAFVTSPSGAAIHDFLQAASERWNDFALLVVPARVQGDQAKDEISRGIEAASRIPGIDAIIVGRGGGSLEDLWAFNEERVVRTLAACPVPTISAVGHEIDVTLSDLAADARALTPTHAAQILFPNKVELAERLQAINQRLTRNVWSRFLTMKRQLDGLSTRSILSRPHDVHLLRRQQIDELEARGLKALQQRIHAGRERVASLARAAEALSPLSVLTRGYSLTATADSRRTLRSVEEVEAGEAIITRVTDGEIHSRVVETRPSKT